MSLFHETYKKRVLFVGIPDMAYVCLDGLRTAGINIVGVVGPKKNHPTYFSFRNFVLQNNLNFIEYDNLNDAFFIDKIKDLHADVAVVCSFNYRIPKVLLNAVKEGFINVHPSLLPEYRGPNPYSAVILNNETETGVTLHFMDENFDTGDIIAQKKVSLLKCETMGTLFNRLNIIGLDILLETLKKYEKDELNREKQPEGEFKKASLIQEELMFINYRQSAKEIESIIRALNPFVLARTMFRDTLTKILTADVIDENSNKLSPEGTIVQIEEDKFYVSTGEGLIAPTSMQFGSFFAGTSKEFIKILNPKIGERFS